MNVARVLEELQIWQLACQLRDEIEVAVGTGTAAHDSDFRDQIERSSRSAPANMAEGFGYFKPRQFAKHLRIARASLMETRSHIHEGKRRHFSVAQANHMQTLAIRTIRGTSSLIRYLDSCPADLDFRDLPPRNKRPAPDAAQATRRAGSSTLNPEPEP